jgi:hypothetical protein
MRHLHTHDYQSAIHNSQAIESAIGPSNQWMDKENVAYICNGVLFTRNGELSYVIWRKMDGIGDHHVEQD